MAGRLCTVGHVEKRSIIGRAAARAAAKRALHSALMESESDGVGGVDAVAAVEQIRASRRQKGGRGEGGEISGTSAKRGMRAAVGDGRRRRLLDLLQFQKEACCCLCLPPSVAPSLPPPRRVDRSTPSPIALEEIELLRKEGRKEGSGFDMAEEEDWIEKRRASGGTRERERERETRRNLDAASSNGAKG